MKLSDIAAQYGDRFLEKYSQRLLPGHIKALQAIQHCRTPAAGMTLLEESQGQVFHSANNFFYQNKRHLLCIIKNLSPVL